MKKEEINPVQLEVRQLSKKFKKMGRDYIRIIHQFCQYDLRRTTKVMSMVQQMNNPMSIIDTLIKKPEKSEELMAQLEWKYNKTFGEHEDIYETEKEEMEAKEEMKSLGYYFFENVPNDTVTKIMSYLDPYSFFRTGVASKRFHQIMISEAQSDYYKHLCTRLYNMEKPKLPFICRFGPIKDYVLQRPLEYRPNTRNAVLNNLRDYIWKMDMNSFNLEPSYYKAYGSYFNMFKCCPRINLNGYYVERDKYVRIGMKDERNPIAPIHVIYFYRYLRFLEDGTVLYHVRNKRLKPEQVMTFLSKELLDNNEKKDTMLGEYIHYQNKLFVKACQNREVFSYEFEIKSSDNKINNELKVVKYTLDLIDDAQEIRQTLYAAHPLKEKLCFYYCKNQNISLENSPVMQASGL